MHSIDIVTIHNLWSKLPENKKISSYSKAIVKLERIRQIEEIWKKDPSQKPNLKTYVGLMEKYIPAAIYVSEFYYSTIEADKSHKMSFAVMSSASNALTKEFKKNIRVTYKWGKYNIQNYLRYAQAICEDVSLLQAFEEFCS